MELTVYHLKNCDTCKKAIKALENAGHELTLIDVRADGIPVGELARLEAAVGYETLMNTRSTTWRSLDDAEKADMTAQKALELMGEYPTLIKRPVIDDGTSTSVGWNKEIAARYT